ncbi:MAG TPA: STAS domain-containing protein [Spirochaetota bacterium]|nr:STAS domain-containing protein [Spirochaetota bacterium]HOM37590.1 STAS domain-containing protein [Spirochaetota bacterium]HPQ49439.1 STAS domain-containing protein [Spirochaetota bacterium]
MNYTIKEDKNKIIIKIEEELLNNENSEALRFLLSESINDGIKNIELDLSNVKATNSSGIAKILFFQKKISEKGGSLKIIDMHPELKKLFHLIGLDNI